MLVPFFIYLQTNKRTNDWLNGKSFLAACFQFAFAFRLLLRRRHFMHFVRHLHRVHLTMDYRRLYKTRVPVRVLLVLILISNSFDSNWNAKYYRRRLGYADFWQLLTLQRIVFVDVNADFAVTLKAFDSFDEFYLSYRSMWMIHRHHMLQHRLTMTHLILL